MDQGVSLGPAVRTPRNHHDLRATRRLIEAWALRCALGSAGPGRAAAAPPELVSFVQDVDTTWEQIWFIFFPRNCKYIISLIYRIFLVSQNQICFIVGSCAWTVACIAGHIQAKKYVCYTHACPQPFCDFRSLFLFRSFLVCSLNHYR